MSSAAPAEIEPGDFLHQVVRVDKVAQSDGGSNKGANQVQCERRASVSAGCLDDDQQVPKLSGLGDSCEVTRCTEPNHIATTARESVAHSDRPVDQIDGASQAPGDHNEQAVPQGNSPQCEVVGSTRLLTTDETKHPAHGVRPTSPKNGPGGYPSETIENQDMSEPPLSGISSLVDASSPAPDSTLPLEDPPPAGVKVMELAALQEQLPHSTSPTGGLVADPAQPAASRAIPGQTVDHGVSPPLTEPPLISPEEDGLSWRKDVRHSDALDAFEGGNEPASGSSWRWSVSTGSDTRSDTPHVLQSPDVHLQQRASLQQQQQHMTLQMQALKKEASQVLTCMGTSADASSSERSESQHSFPNGLRSLRIDPECESKNVHCETYTQYRAYGKAKIATDVLAGLVGMQPVAIITCFVCEAALGGVLSMFCLFFSAFSHYDKRPASYFLCSLLAFALANTFVIALSLKLAGFEHFHTAQQLHRMGIAHTIVLFFLSILAGGLGVRSFWASSARRESCCGQKRLEDQGRERGRS